MNSTCIYSDHLIRIESDKIIFHNYYFLSGKEKTVRIDQIDHIAVKKPTFWSGKYRISGMGDFKTWFPSDVARPKRDKIFVTHLKKKWLAIGFTVERSAEVEAILNQFNLIK